MCLLSTNDIKTTIAIKIREYLCESGDVLHTEPEEAIALVGADAKLIV